ncbi:nicotinate-nucleotide--dimethylbenzimidazole phosphoribosyltransferase [Photobacterium sp. GB-3]|uniref:nicotinate-nucleotide--dimethylbenzimidazole phosphoribosyltransferase n=1 Tax=Photobacterium sp. GB-3 TaxID=2022110 RepID=UPI000D16AF79|nr:nicotinate-nucleotide--dimethylbenzimidazole phosphoribosyltransferase [Photobacterium sp. GB-3]PSV58397.1 nicotinate-nucleotide--dimethylbenzimidazole phosphoribosyltransferase [Photobacterium sp. GB-3]
MFTIYPVDKTQSVHIKKRIDNKTKPIGALGQLEPLAEQLALIQQSDRLTIDNPHLLIFAADHGISQHGISIASAEVTTQMVHNFLAGGAAANCFCHSNNMALKIVDAGILGDVNDHPDLIRQPLGKGTQDFTTQNAMSLDTVKQGISAGASVVDSLHQSGTNLVAFGEMGIGNTSSAAAIMALLLNLPADACTGHGTGIDDSQYQKKLALIRLACKHHYSATGDPLKVLSAVGGFEVAQITGGILQAAENRMIVLVDGFIVTAAALLAVAINPNVIDYLVFCHHSEEAGHHRMLQHLNASPLLNLGLRLGEGTGAVLALPLIKAACAFYNDMASFDDAGVTV